MGYKSHKLSKDDMAMFITEILAWGDAHGVNWTWDN